MLKQIKVGNTILEQFNESCDSEAQLQTRITMLLMSGIVLVTSTLTCRLANTYLNIEIRKQLAKQFTQSVLTYRFDSWSFGKAKSDKLEEIKIWIQRRITKTS